MKAILLCGGRGSRLGKLTEFNPKPLVEISGKPILEHLLTNARDAGINNYLVSLGYRGNMIQDYFGNGSRWGIRIQYFQTLGKCPEEPILSVRQYLAEGTFCCFCGDNILLQPQIERIIGFHSQANADATFTLEHGEPAAIKRVRLNGNRIVGSSTSAEHPILVYNMAMQTSFLDLLIETLNEKEEKAFAFTMDTLAINHNIYALEVPFININNPSNIQEAERILAGEKDAQR